MNAFCFLFNVVSIIIYFVLNNKINPEGCCSSCFNIDSEFLSSDGSMKKNNITTKHVVKPVVTRNKNLTIDNSFNESNVITDNSGIQRRKIVYGGFSNEDLFKYICLRIEEVIVVLQYFFDRKIKSIFNFNVDLINNTNYYFVRKQLSQLIDKIYEKCTRHPNLGYKDVDPGQYYDLMCILKDSTINVDKEEDFGKTKFNIKKLINHLKADGNICYSNFFNVFQCSMHCSMFAYNLSKAISPIGLFNGNTNSAEFDAISDFLHWVQDKYDRKFNNVIEYFEIVFDDSKVAIQDTNENYKKVSSFIDFYNLERHYECENFS